MPNADTPGTPQDEVIHHLRARVDRDFFGRTLSQIDTLVARSGFDYMMRAAAFTSQVMPDLKGLEQLEDLFMQSAMNQVSHVQHEDRTSLLLIGACLLAFFCFLLIALRVAERVVVHPLLLARKEIIGVAKGGAAIITWLDLLNAADGDLYRAKAQGRNQLLAAPECASGLAHRFHANATSSGAM